MLHLLTTTLLLLTGTTSASASTSPKTHASLSLHLPPTAPLPLPQTLPPSTTLARLHNANLTLTAPLRRNSRFFFAAVPEGSYLCDVWAHEWVFVPMRVDVTPGRVDGQKARVEVWQTFRGNEWDNRGERLGEAGGGMVPVGKGESKGEFTVLEVNVGVLGRRQFFEQRQAFNPVALLKNPMILIGLVALVMMFVMPKMIESMDPEMREEFEKQQANSPFNALAGGMTGQGGAAGGFDMAAWMAGSDGKKEQGQGQGQGKASGADGGASSAKRRR